MTYNVPPFRPTHQGAEVAMGQLCHPSPHPRHPLVPMGEVAGAVVVVAAVGVEEEVVGLEGEEALGATQLPPRHPTQATGNSSPAPTCTSEALMPRPLIRTWWRCAKSKSMHQCCCYLIHLSAA